VVTFRNEGRWKEAEALFLSGLAGWLDGFWLVK